VDYEASSENTNMDINVVHLSSDYFVVLEEDMSHLQFGPREAVFQKPSEKDNHLKVLNMRGHINGKMVTRMFVDGGAIVNLMPYFLYKKLGSRDEELIKTNMTVSGIGGSEPIGAKGVASMELTFGSKTFATSFFISEVQSNFSLILRRDWIHANQCVPSTLHHFLFNGSATRLRWSMETLRLLLLWPIPILLVHMTTSSVYRAWICPIMI
jgi:hypothetical protein